MLILHIGRGKTGSTSLQRALHAQRERVLAAGWFMPEAADTLGNHAKFVTAIRENDSSHESVQVVRDALADPDARVLLTSEFLFDLKADHIQRVRELSAGHDVMLIAYLRDYTSWVPSLYAQPTKKGNNLLSFDEFYSTHLETFSAMPALTRWADVFGWSALSIRPIVNGTVGENTLFEDFSETVGVEIIEEARQNISPHWAGLELRRAFTALRQQLSPEDAHFLRWLLERATLAARKADLPNGYLTPDQAAELNRRYRDDLMRLGSVSGCQAPAHLPTPALRRLEPRIESVPLAVREALVEECRNYTRRPVSEDVRDLAISLLSEPLALQSCLRDPAASTT